MSDAEEATASEQGEQTVRVEATRTKINDMRQRLDNLRKRKLEEAAEDVQLIGEQMAVADVSPSKKPKSDDCIEISSSPPSEVSPSSPTDVISQHRKAIADQSIELIELDGDQSLCDQPKERPASISSQRNGSDGPLLKLVFLNETIASLHGKAIKDAIMKIISKTDESALKSSRPAKFEMTIYQSDVVQKSGEKGELFELDTEPAESTASFKVPSYLQSFSVPMDGQESSQEEEPKFGPSCFNCSGAHILSDCPNPIDHELIAQRRNKFNAEKKASNGFKTRYHVDNEQKFSNHKPGVISDELRNALGLRPDQLPLHIYHMRMFGYPPGWLADMRETESGISLIENSTDKVGEEARQTCYDKSKIIEFPGFNTPCPRGVTDESRILGLPPIHWDFSKEAMLQEIERKYSGVTQNIQDDDDVMIIDNGNGSNSVTVSSKEASKVDPNADLNEAVSPDIDELEAQKSLILNELDDSPSSPKQTSTPVPPQTPEASLGRSMSLSIGTPVMKSASPFEKLPAAGAFSVGVSEHLNFENLPGSTGKYQRMKEIINKAKKAVDY